MFEDEDELASCLCNRTVDWLPADALALHSPLELQMQPGILLVGPIILLHVTIVIVHTTHIVTLPCRFFLGIDKTTTVAQHTYAS